MSIRISNLSKNYGTQPALTHVSFEVGANEIVAFLGPNGAGKSTCMRILTGGLRPDRGEALVCGYSPCGQPLEARRSFGYLSENNPLYPEMYVREYLTFIARMYPIQEQEARVDEIIHSVLLNEVADKKIGTLSRGFRQRVGLAAAILPDAPVLILDEPLSGLDPNQQDDILELIAKLGTQKSILFSTHTLNEVEKIAQRVIILSEGRVQADETLESLTASGTLEETFKKLTR